MYIYIERLYIHTYETHNHVHAYQNKSKLKIDTVLRSLHISQGISYILQNSCLLENIGNAFQYVDNASENCAIFEH